MNIQWYPGHMAKTRRMIGEKLRQVDAVCELLDARIPSASRNPDIDALTAGKPRLVILNRADQADPGATDRWAAWFREKGAALITDARSGRGTEKFVPAVRALLAEKLRAYAEKGQTGRIVRLMVLGIPNVGKSAFINRVAGRRAAKAEDRPGVTRTGQWVPVSGGLELLDTPGILWPKFEDPLAARYLAFTGAVKDDVLDGETLGCYLAAWFADHAPEALTASYRLPGLPVREADEEEIPYGWRVLDALARRRGFLVSGGETDTERMANTLLDEFRAGKLGRFTLETP
ncbi:MAG: ribosome biogenesis GTPase YlqF, partial [Oscillibacter sp.]|nr:ribosome biogenesis GTPase YlqF [Oscillibacter sp.]